MANKNPAISIIIAMFNAQRYIEDCLKTLLYQTFQDFEVIIVDDCSTDRSAEIVKSFMNRFDGRLQLIKTKRNSGTPGLPRNLALKSARGKYITFFDSDDMLTKTALEELYNLAEEFDAEVVHPERYYEMPDGSNHITPRTFQMPPFVKEPTLETDDLGDRVERFTQKKFLWWACNKLFRRDFLLKNKIEFPRVEVFEDMCFFIQALVHAKIYVRVPNVVYIYRIRNDSISHDPPHPFDITRNMIDVFHTLDKFLSAQDFFACNRKYRFMLLDFFIRQRIKLVSNNIYALSDPAEIDEYLRRNIFNVKPAENVALTCHLFDLVNILNLEIERLQKEIIHGK